VRVGAEAACVEGVADVRVKTGGLTGAQAGNKLMSTRITSILFFIYFADFIVLLLCWF
jgi:hypothetical protein